jgi:cation transport ATPase
VAMESADVTLVKGDLRGIARARAEPGHHAQYP